MFEINRNGVEPCGRRRAERRRGDEWTSWTTDRRA
jgi:hypothetical protein